VGLSRNCSMSPAAAAAMAVMASQSARSSHTKTIGLWEQRGGIEQADHFSGFPQAIKFLGYLFQ
jgi:hypothetical protein